jgi:outer membrane protein W
LGKNWGLSSGVSFMELNTNLTQNGATASLQNSYLQIPLKIGGDYVIFNMDQSNSKIFLNVGAGFYASTLLKSELQTISGSTTTKNLGWNYGIVFNTGVKFLISDKTSIGIGFEGQGDISKMKKDGVERKVEQLNSIYFSFGFKF